MSGALLALALVVGAAPAAPSAPPAVVLLPLVPDGTTSVKQARGITAQLRDALVSGPTADGLCTMLSASKDDDKQAERCRRDAGCLGEVAALRGADVMLAGVIAPGADGLVVSLVAAAPSAKEALRRVEVTLRGDAGDARRIDRVVRSAVGPHALRGKLALTGDEGATVTLDGVARGVLPLTEPQAKPLSVLVEGEHDLLVEKPGFEPYRRPVAIVHAETVEVKATLLPLTSGDRARVPDGAGGAASDGPPLDVLVVGGVGAGLVALGAVAGTWSLLDALAVQARAEEQQLLFPRDAGLLLRGQILAWTADGLYLVGLGALGVAGALALLTPAEPQP
ncbi:MAG: PEGA domain-containing protein [Deltaproteobacteria bacterium]|nr:PEGA domain-containing protein [Deltaproteobacteria bacterium]